MQRRTLGRTNLTVSPVGFGGYRVSIGVEQHRLALRRAVEKGVNLFDTSANYADGGSEELIGGTLREMARDGAIRREDVVLVTKGGYIQGENFRIAQERLSSGSGFPDVVDYAPGLWHSISPEFLHDQIGRSLGRLGMRRVDVYLLHNPEYYLGWASREGVPLEEARAEYRRRLADAFRHLEREVADGRIAWYGVSSNSFVHPSSSPEFTSLDMLLEIAEEIEREMGEHHFAVIQLPANLAERGFVLEKNNAGRSVVERGREAGLGILINRPLNAIVDDALVRLADFPTAEAPAPREEIERMIGELSTLETGLRDRLLLRTSADSDEARGVREFLDVGGTVAEHWEDLGPIERFNEVLSQHFSPRMGWVVQFVREHGTQEDVDAVAGWLATARALFHVVGARYARGAQERSDRLRGVVGAAVEDAVDGSLSALAIRLLLGVDGVSCVLVGMRRDEYVDDVVAAAEAGPLGGAAAWERMASLPI